MKRRRCAPLAAAMAAAVLCTIGCSTWKRVTDAAMAPFTPAPKPTPAPVLPSVLVSANEKQEPARRVEQETGGDWFVCVGENCPMTGKPKLGAVPELKLRTASTAAAVTPPSRAATGVGVGLRPIPAGGEGRVTDRITVADADFQDGALVLRSKLAPVTAANRSATYQVTLLISSRPNAERDKMLLARANQLDEILQMGGVAAKQIGFRTVPAPSAVTTESGSVIGEIAVVVPSR